MCRPINAFALPGSEAQFWMRVVILIMLAFFGYQTPKLPKISEAKFARERLSDTLLGLFLGVLNGYLIVGTLWYFLAQANYAPRSSSSWRRMPIRRWAGLPSRC